MKETWYQLPEEDCERINRTEMQAVRWCLSAVNSVAYAQDDLSKRLECIPNGKVRWRLMLGHLRALMNDILGTVPVKQCKTIRNTTKDMEIRLVPKLSVQSDRAVVDLKDLSFLVRHAKKDICTSCILTDEECRTCELYKILESIAPLEDYGDGTTCPYTKEDWYDK